jgi:hypothetical protein
VRFFTDAQEAAARIFTEVHDEVLAFHLELAAGDDGFHSGNAFARQLGAPAARKAAPYGTAGTKRKGEFYPRRFNRGTMHFANVPQFASLTDPAR